MSVLYRQKTLASWQQPPFSELSEAPSGKLLHLFLELGPLSVIVPGVTVAGRGALADFLPWPPAKLDEALDELAEHGAVIDLANRVLFLPWLLTDAAPTSPNVVKAWRTRWSELPACSTKDVIDGHVRRFLVRYGASKAKTGNDRWAAIEPWIRAWDLTFTEDSLKSLESQPPTFVEGARGPFGKVTRHRSESHAGTISEDSARPSPNQKQDQDQEQESGSGTRKQETEIGGRTGSD